MILRFYISDVSRLRLFLTANAAPYLLAPRGIGTMFGMFLAGKLAQKADPRQLILFGLFLTILSLWEMSTFNNDISAWLIVRNGILQGLGLALILLLRSPRKQALLSRCMKRWNKGSLFLQESGAKPRMVKPTIMSIKIAC